MPKSSLKLLLIFLLSFAICSCQIQDPSPVRGPSKQRHFAKKVSSKTKYHLVKKNDTLISIAKQYNVKTKKIIEVNNLSKPFRLRIGKRIKIPQDLTKHSPLKKTKNISNPKKKSSFFKLRSPLGRKDFIWPAHGEVIKSFNWSNTNAGINIKLPKNHFIRASKEGKVIYAKSKGESYDDFGKLIIIQHDDLIQTAYAHLDSISVKKGTIVKKNQIIGKSGSTGSVNSTQLYFSIRVDGNIIDPDSKY